MDSQAYRHCRNLFREAKALPASEWAAFIRDRCSGDRQLESELAGLLDAVRNPDPLSPLNVDPSEQPIPNRVGNWGIVDEIGRGGAGIVYIARRIGAPRGGVVALKIVRSDRLTADAVARFANERKLLTTLRHNNIARILDSGQTETRLPFFVMEYVDGSSIGNYCRRLRLTIRQRVRLFRQVCVAVQFLHDYGILHRDITPNNLLVTPDGLVKIVDFGISKAYDRVPTTTEGSAGFERMMTPAYASPEQLAQKELTRQSDLYSMGVVLYELLTGALPEDAIDPGGLHLPNSMRGRRFTKASERTLARREQDPGIPETAEQARKLLRGSLDNILAVALRQEAGQRYRTAEALRIDLGRHLEGLDTFADRQNRSFSLARFFGR